MSHTMTAKTLVIQSIALLHVPPYLTSKHTYMHTHLEVSTVTPSYIFTCKCTGEKCQHQCEEFC